MTDGRSDGLPSCPQKRREKEKFGEFFFLFFPELSVGLNRRREKEVEEKEVEEEFESVLAAHIRVRDCQECQGAATTQDEPGPPATGGVKAGRSSRAKPSRPLLPVRTESLGGSARRDKSPQQIRS